MQEQLSDNEQGARLTDREKRILFSPLRLILLLAVSIFIIEIATMAFVAQLPELSLAAECFLDSLLLTVFLFPILFFYVFRPLFHLVTDYRAGEHSLLLARDNLEQKVAERTHALNEAMQRLEEENEERRRAEIALRESEDRFRQIFEQSEDAIVMISPDEDAILDINPVAEKLFGKEREVLITGGVRGLFISNDIERLVKVINDLRAGGAGDFDHIDVRCGTGDQRILSFRGKLISLRGTTVLYTTFRDITRRVRLEEESREIQARLIHANRMTSLGLLVASVAHEINNPNNYILMNAAILQKSWKDIHSVLRERYEQDGEFMVGRTPYSEAARFLPDVYDGIADGARRISEIVDNLKDFGRDDSGGLHGLVDMNAVVRLSVSILNHHISRTTRHFSLDLDDALPLVRGSVRQLEQVVINLIINSLQSLPDVEHGVRVSTSLGADGEHVMLQIADQGNGIPDEIASRVMEPFFTTRLDRGGTGLGLAICVTIVRDHQGTIGFESTPGEGTVFSVSLRRAVPDENDTQEMEVCRAGQ